MAGKIRVSKGEGKRIRDAYEGEVSVGARSQQGIPRRDAEDASDLEGRLIVVKYDEEAQARLDASLTALLRGRNATDREYVAWRQLCKQLDKLGVDINVQEPLACAIRLWGEELHQLRDQNPEHTDEALKIARHRYDPHVIDNWDPRKGG